MHPSSPIYTYAFSQVAMREALVFKSLVGLLSGRTSTEWVHISQGTPDVLVMGSDPGAESYKTDMKQVTCLSLGGGNDTHRGVTVALPIRPNELLDALERLAAILQDDTGSHDDVSEQVAYRLLRWPSEDLLAGQSHLMRLAALLNAIPIKLVELSERSRLPMDQCRAFITALQRRGLLVQESAQPIVAPAKKGFFARLRAHLGLANNEGER